MAIENDDSVKDEVKLEAWTSFMVITPDPQNWFHSTVHASILASPDINKMEDDANERYDDEESL